MKLTCISILFLLSAGIAAQAQTTRQLIDSARRYRLGNHQKAILFATAAQKQAKAEKQAALAGESTYLLGVGNYLEGKYDEALRLYFDAEQEYINLKDTAHLSELYADMCLFYLKLKKFEEADKVSDKAIRYARAVKDTILLAGACNNHGLMLSDQHKNDSAIAAFTYCYNLYKKIDNKIGMAYSLDYLSSVLEEKGMFDEAFTSMNESKQLRAGIGDKTGEAIALENIGELFMSEKKAREAIPYFQDAISKAHDLNYTDLESYAYNNQAKAYEQQGDYKKAYSAQQKYLELNQRLMDQKRTQIVEELQTKYETKEKEEQNKLLTEKNELQTITLSRNKIALYALIFITLLVIVLFYLLYNRSKLNQKARLKETIFEQQKLKAQGMIDAEENERQRLARELHDGVGQLLSAARRKIQLQGSTSGASDSQTDETLKLLDDSIKEVRDLSHSMMPPSLLNKNLRQAIEEFVSRVSQDGSLTISTEWVNTDDLKLEKPVTLMLYRSIQEIVTNAMRHAKATNIQIEMVHHNTELTLMVYDDGVGFDKDELLQTGKGMGLKNIQSRIAYIGGNLHLDTMPGKGTTYIIELPL